MTKPVATEIQTTRTICERYQISRQTFWRMTKKADFPAPIRFGRAIRWDLAAVEAYLMNQGAN